MIFLIFSFEITRKCSNFLHEIFKNNNLLLFYSTFWMYFWAVKIFSTSMSNCLFKHIKDASTLPMSRRHSQCKWKDFLLRQATKIACRKKRDWWKSRLHVNESEPLDVRHMLETALTCMQSPKPNSEWQRYHQPQHAQIHSYILTHWLLLWTIDWRSKSH